MTKQELETYISEKYQIIPVHLFQRDPYSCVFQHSNEHKWFAVLMRVSYQSLGISKCGEVDILTVRCDTANISSMYKQDGVVPAYYMDKDKWITVLIDGTIQKDTLVALVDMSFELTRSRALRKRTIPQQVLRKRKQRG